MSTPTRTPKRGVWSVLVGAVVALVALLAGIGAGTPAYAHSGGKAVVLVRELAFTPAATGTGYDARLRLADLDSGAAIVAADAKLTVGKAAPIVLEPSAAEGGVYTAKLPKLAAGAPTDMRLVVRTAPGGIAVALFDRTYQGVTLTAGEGTVVTAEAAGGGGGSNTGMIIGVAGAVLLVALLYGLFSVRRRGAVPARAK